MRKFFQIIVTVGLIAIWPLTAGAQTPEPTFGLKDAYQRANNNNPSLQQVRESVNQVATNIGITRSYILPNVSGIVRADRRKDESLSRISSSAYAYNAYNIYDTGLTATQPLFAIGSLSAISSAKQDKQIADLGVDIASRNLGVNVIQSYFQVVLNVRNVDTLLRQERIVTDSLKTTEHRYHTGRSQLLDVLQVKTQIALLAAQIADAHNSVDIALANLSNVLGEPTTKNFPVKNTLEYPDLVMIDADLKPEASHIPEVEQNEVQLKQIPQLRSVAWGKNLPYLNFTGTYNYQNTHLDQLFSDNASNWDVGLVLNIPIFSGLSALYQQDAIKSQELQLRDARQNLLNQTNLQQTTNRKLLETALQNVRTGEVAFKLAEESSKEAIRQYRLATIDFLQFLVIHQAYVQAEQTLNASKYNYLVALANYYSSMGHNVGRLIDILDKANS